MAAIRVLIVDDSALIRQLLTEILRTAADISIVGTANDPVQAWSKIQSLSPDVITLDVEMPRMDGLSFLEKLMAMRPTPVVMISALTERGCAATVRALELGACDFVAKPKVDIRDGTVALGEEIIAKVRTAATARLRRPRHACPQPRGKGVTHLESISTIAVRETTRSAIVALGASTGGTQALFEVLRAMPADGPPTLVVQHMPPGFTRAFAARLDANVAMQVHEARDGDRVLPGRVLIAPGDQHLVVVRSGADHVVRLMKSERVSGHRPSVDVLFDSMAAAVGANAVGALLTGMGADGAAGLLRMRMAGAHTIAQDEESCVVFGMPREAILRGAAVQVVSLDAVSAAVLTACRRSAAR